MCVTQARGYIAFMEKQDEQVRVELAVDDEPAVSALVAVVAPRTNLGVERQRFWNRYPRLSAALWFGGAATAAGLIGGLIAMKMAGSLLGDLTPSVVTCILSGFVYGMLLGQYIGRRGSSPKEAFAASGMGAVIVLLSYLTGSVVFVANWWAITAGARPELHNILGQVFGCTVLAVLTTGIVVFPFGILTASKLYWLRTKVPPGPRVLGCGKREH
jgi:hypothetical protein